jgi:hypothetical protein
VADSAVDRPPDAPQCATETAARAANYRERVALVDGVRDAAVEQWHTSGGQQGVAPRSSPLVARGDGAGHLVVQDLPAPIADAVAAREAYLREVPPRCDADVTIDYALYVGTEYELYGHFNEARRWLLPVYETRCGVSPHGYEAWKLLLIMSNIEQDAVQSRQLADAQQRRPCAVNTGLPEASPALRDAVLRNAGVSAP